jgi:hypothetical protein
MRAGVVVVHWAIMVYGAVRESHAFDQPAVLDKSTQRFILIVRWANNSRCGSRNCQDKKSVPGELLAHRHDIDGGHHSEWLI